MCHNFSTLSVEVNHKNQHNRLYSTQSVSYNTVFVGTNINPLAFNNIDLNQTEFFSLKKAILIKKHRL